MPPTADDEQARPSVRGFVLHPSQIPRVTELCDAAKASLWTADDVKVESGDEEPHPASAETEQLLDLVLAVRASALPENMATARFHSEAVAFLGLQTMQEYLHLEVAIYLNKQGVPQTHEKLLRLPDPPPTGQRRKVEDVFEHTVIYAAVLATGRSLLRRCTRDTTLESTVKRVVLDYERSYAFGIMLCAACATELDITTFWQLSRSVAEGATGQCQAMSPQIRQSICESFAQDIRVELELVGLPGI